MHHTTSVDMCGYRSQPRPEVDAEVATCDLLRQLSGVSALSLVTVRRDACEFCMQAGERSPLQLNPVIASLLFDLTRQILQTGGAPGCTAEQANLLRLRAEASLDADPSDVDNPPLPPQEAARCHYLGGQAGHRVNGPQGVADRIPVFACHHPDHDQTTEHECIRCQDWTDRPRIGAGILERWLPIPAVRCGPAVARWSVGVTTAPRRRPTLESTLDSLVRAGWDTARLFVDGAVTIPGRYAHLPVTYREPKLGAWPNFYLALAELLMQDPEADAYLMIQDDVLFYDRANLREYLERALWPGLKPGPVSLYTSTHDVRPETGWHRHAGDWFLGALAFIFPKASAIEFLLDPRVFAHRLEPGTVGLTQVDTTVGAWAHRAGTPIHFPCPSLCRHTGHSSSLWPSGRAEGIRKEGAFAGEIPNDSPPGSRHAPAFPESAFPCPHEIARDYERRLELGTKRMRQRSVVICGIGRDVAAHLPTIIARVERLGKMFRTYRAVFYENDSTDATPALLADWAIANPAVHVLSEKRGLPRFGQIRCTDRASLLAAFRNRYRAYILEYLHDFDHVIVVDLDLAGGWSLDGIAHTFSHDDWDFVGSNGLWSGPPPAWNKPVYFDIWAHRNPGHWTPERHAAHCLEIFQRGDPMRPVWSCFGGLGIYRTACFEAEYGGDDCEHVVLHRRMRTLGYDRVFLNPNQIVLYEPWSAPTIANAP